MLVSFLSLLFIYNVYLISSMAKTLQEKHALKVSSLTKIGIIANVPKLDDDIGTVSDTATLRLDNLEVSFQKGKWQADLFEGLSSEDIENLRKENGNLSNHIELLTEENNMLKLKVAILLDMLSETTAESHILERERNEALSLIRKSKTKKKQ